MYKINVGNFTVGETVYPNRCLSASIGGGGIDSDVIPWEGTNCNPWDFKYEDGAFILDVIVIPPTPVQPSEMDVMQAQLAYTAMMTDTLIQ